MGDGTRWQQQRWLQYGQRKRIPVTAQRCHLANRSQRQHRQSLDNIILLLLADGA
jgi:hypothetical protein